MNCNLVDSYHTKPGNFYPRQQNTSAGSSGQSSGDEDGLRCDFYAGGANTTHLSVKSEGTAAGRFNRNSGSRGAGGYGSSNGADKQLLFRCVNEDDWVVIDTRSTDQQQQQQQPGWKAGGMRRACSCQG